MKRRLAALGVVAAALAGFLIFAERHHGPGGGATGTEARRLLPGLSRAAIVRIRIARPAGTFVLVREQRTGGGDVPDGADSGWTVATETTPAATATGGGATPKRLVSSAAVDGLLEALEDAAVDRVAPPGARAGLEPPAALLEITIERGPDPTWRLAIGNADASGRGAFVRRVDDADTLVVGRHLAEVADRPVDAFCDRHLVPDPAALRSMAALSFEAGGVTDDVHLTGGLWINRARFRVAREAVEAAARALVVAEAASFLPAPPSPPPHGRSALVVKAFGAAPAGAPLFALDVKAGEAALCDAKDARDARDTQEDIKDTRDTKDANAAGAGRAAVRTLGGGTADGLCVTAAAVAELARALAGAARRDLRLLGARPDEIARVTIEHGGGNRLVLARGAGAAGADAGSWRVLEPHVAWVADPDEVERWLERLAAVRLQPLGRQVTATSDATAEATLSIEHADGAREIIRTFGPAQGHLTIRRAEEGAPAAGPTALRAELTTDPTRFRDRRVLRLARYDLARIRAADDGGAHGGDTAVALRKDPATERWSLAGGAGAALDDPALEALLSAVTDLVAARFLPTDAPLEIARTLDLTTDEPHGGGGAGAGAAAKAATTHRLEIGHLAAGPPRRRGHGAGAERPGGDDGCAARLTTGPVTFALPAQTCAALLRPLVTAAR